MYSGPVGRGCHDVHICDLRTCRHAHLGFADVQQTCTYAICGSAIVFTCLQPVCHVVSMCLPRGCMWQPRGNNCTSANRVCAILQIPCRCACMHVCRSANRVCASPQIPDVHVCTSANRVCARPQIPDVHVCTSANRRCARHDNRDLPGHRSNV